MDGSAIKGPKKPSFATVDSNDPRVLQILLTALAHRALTQRGGKITLRMEDIPDSMQFQVEKIGDKMVLSLMQQSVKAHIVTASPETLAALPSVESIIAAVKS